MGQALYRKYRSAGLQEIVGQDHITSTLENAVSKGRISHAYLFTGPRGVGKTSIARIIAHRIANLPYNGTQHLDIIEIDAASNNGVEDIRDLRDKVQLAPSTSSHKIYIIDEVHMLSGAAFNALLKTLEEPPAHAVFILATTEAHKLPPTIVSRTQRFTFRPVAKEKVVAHLSHIAKQENIAISPEALELVADHGEGSFRDSISLLDQLSSVVHNAKIERTDVERVLGMASNATIAEILVAALKGDAVTLLRLIREMLASGVATAVIVKQLVAAARDKAPTEGKLYDLLQQLLEIPRSYDPQVKLEVVLMQFGLKNKSASAHVQNHPPQTPSTPQQTTKKESRQPSKATVTAPPIVAEETATQAEAIPTISAEAATIYVDTIPPKAWQAIVAQAKQSGPTLYTILRQAILHFDTEKQLLTLTFRFPLHKKRFEEQRHAVAFNAILTEILGGIPNIQVVVNKDAAKKDILPKEELATLPVPAEVDASTSTVLAMMGGEIVNA